MSDEAIHTKTLRGIASFLYGNIKIALSDFQER